MFKQMLTAVAFSIALASGTASAQTLPTWGTVDEVMGYNGSLSPLPKGQTKGLHPNADFYANKMWCRDVRVKTAQQIDNELGVLFSNAVEFNPRGTTQHHQVNEFQMQIRLWNSQQIMPQWERMMGDPQLKYQQCDAFALQTLTKFRGAVKIFMDGNDNFKR
jgi:hypothetical protein